MQYSLLAVALVAEAVVAFPFIANQPGVDSTLLKRGSGGFSLSRRQQSSTGLAGSEADCPYNPNHVEAAPVTDAYPYGNAKNGAPGSGKGGYLVPHPDDPDHQYQAPRAGIDIRGPCPGLNTAANYNFLPRDGIATFNELVNAQQNVYNVGYDLAVTLALLGLTTTDGDLITEKLSIGCDATNRTSYNAAITGSEPGLDGHNKFEADTSLTRNDYFLSNGNNFDFNGTLFAMMTETTGGLYNRDNLALYREQRYYQSYSENPNFYFGPFSLLLFGASSFLYELMPGGYNDYTPDFDTISTFFGAVKQSDGTYTHVPEQIPANWTNRLEPYSLFDVGREIILQYLEHPVLFGGATGNGGFDLLNYGAINNGSIEFVALPEVNTTVCLIYQIATERLPSSLNGLVTPLVDLLNNVVGVLEPGIKNLGCPLSLT